MVGTFGVASCLVILSFFNRCTSIILLRMHLPSFRFWPLLLVGAFSSRQSKLRSGMTPRWWPCSMRSNHSFEADGSAAAQLKR